MRVQIIIDDGEGDESGVSYQVSKKEGRFTTQDVGNGDGPYWRGPFFLATPDEAASIGLQVGAAEEPRSRR